MKFDVIHAWKDESYRASLSEAERSQLPAHPAGELFLSDAELEAVFGGWAPETGGVTEGDSNLCGFAVITGSNVAASVNADVNALIGITLGAFQGAQSKSSCIH